MKEFLKSVKIWESYCQTFGGFLSGGHGVKLESHLPDGVYWSLCRSPWTRRLLLTVVGLAIPIIISWAMCMHFYNPNNCWNRSFEFPHSWILCVPILTFLAVSQTVSPDVDWQNLINVVNHSFRTQLQKLLLTLNVAYNNIGLGESLTDSCRVVAVSPRDTCANVAWFLYEQSSFYS